MWERLRRFSSLPGPAKALFLRAALLLPLLTLSLRISGFQKTRQRLQAALNARNLSAAKGDLTASVSSTTRMVLAAARHSPIKSTCLERSLVLWWFLARQGIAARLRIGVRTAERRFSAHAWVEYEGMTL